MKILLDNKYLVPTTEGIIEVKNVGGYGKDKKFVQLGEPADIQLIPDSQVVAPEDTEAVVEESTAKKLKAAEDELIKVHLELNIQKRAKTLAGDVVTEAEALAYLKTLDYSYKVNAAKLSEVQVWLKEQEDK